jgi:hypothetical protein
MKEKKIVLPKEEDTISLDKIGDEDAVFIKDQGKIIGMLIVDNGYWTAVRGTGKNKFIRNNDGNSINNMDKRVVCRMLIEQGFQLVTFD